LRGKWLLCREGSLNDERESVYESVRQAEELVLVGPHGEDGREDEVDLHHRKTRAHGSQLREQTRVLAFEIAERKKETFSIFAFH
jgi:hypothetical protein